MALRKQTSSLSQLHREERRNSTRYQIKQTATLLIGDNQFACTVVNASASGALVETSFVSEVGTMVVLDAASWDRLEAEVVHVKGGYVGLKFLDDSAGKVDAVALDQEIA